MNELIILPYFSVQETPSGERIVMRRFLKGVEAYAQRWPGQVTVLIRHGSEPQEGLDPVVFHADEYPFDLEPLPSDSFILKKRLAQADVILATLDTSNLKLSALCQTINTALVWITETSVRTRAQIIKADTSSLIRRGKRLLSNQLTEFFYQQAVRQASAVQCNGLPTFQDYQTINPQALLFFDSRINQDNIIRADKIIEKSGHIKSAQPLRLAFSGRLTEIKGVQYLPAVAEELRCRHIPFTLDIYGEGDLSGELEEAVKQKGLEAQVKLHGVADFYHELIPTFQQSIDIFLCCHPQGDPSCTYLETLACGVPIVGFDNEAWTGLQSISQAGWVVETGNITQIADTLEQIHRDRSLWLKPAQAGQEFALQNTFEQTMDLRIEHLKQITHLKTQSAELSTEVNH